MIEDQTLTSLSVNYCELCFSDNARTRGWTLKAVRIVHYGMEKFEEVKFEGTSIADCIEQAVNYARTKASG